MRVCVLLLLSASVSAGDLLPAAFFDPSEPVFGMPAIEPREFAELTGERKLLARGFEPGGYFAPPRYEDSIPQAMTAYGRPFAGFSYAMRLQEKRRFWRITERSLDLSERVELLERLPLREPREFLERYRSLADGIDPARRAAGQALLALRHSERQFRAWWVDELGREAGEAPRPVQRKVVRMLSGLLRHRDLPVALGAARVLGAIGDKEAVRVVDRALARFDDPDLLAALVHARARQGGEGIAARLAGWAGHDEPAVACAAIAALGANGDAWSLDVLRKALPGATGGRAERIASAIAAREGEEPPFDGDVDFYGIRTRSRSVVFCVDVSISMGFPMDGRGGQREPRRTRTVRELARTIEKLPDGVEFNVMLFSGRLTPLWRRLRPVDRQNRAAALEFVRNSPIEPGTDVWAAVDAALRSGADTAYLLGDGEPSVGVLRDPSLLLHEFAARNVDRRLRIHAVGLSRDQNTELLFNLATSSGGRFLADR